MKVKLHAFDLKIRDTFKIARETRDSQETLIVELEDRNVQGDIVSGLGETTANPYYGFTVEKMQEEIEGLREMIENFEINNIQEGSGLAGKPETFWEYLFPHLQKSSFTLCALDMAAHDLYGKKLGKPLYQIWGLDPKKVPASNYTIGIDGIEKMVQKMKAMPWPLYKIKLGTEEDLEIVRELRKHTDARFRVDANCAWGVEETINNSVELKKLGVEFIEQPMHAADMEGMKEVFKHSALPLIADESCITETDVAKCHHHFHGVNIKLTKCGGLTPALRMIAEARQLNMKVMVGCMTESTVGISAIAHLSPLLDYVDMDGALLLAEDIATGVKVKPDGVDFAQENGTGARLITSNQLQEL
ncbi:dipeptide epimerase [Catalinimonas niigatensis]|uniref:dipeptide epimerase n=1 Tax=Catalinimonas niigatensis TaxID=1397264 RepID=UPI0026668138|nr:dipeptide epimerase [Catalinimonas niigatensis]WPP48269.1 dipeptide epimerase [Catalinimonas niigatensis]